MTTMPALWWKSDCRAGGMKSLHETTEDLEYGQHPDPHAFTLSGTI